MSTTESVSRTALDLACGKCAHLNAATAKFCGGCGHSLFEPCAGCGHSVRLTEKYCGDCGADLEKTIRLRIEQAEQSMASAVQAAKEYRYADAISRLDLLARNQDYRLAEITMQAKQAVDKIETLRDQMVSRATAAMESAKSAFALEDRTEVIRLLQSVPTGLLDQASVKLLEQCNAFLREINLLTASVRSALAEKNWITVGTLIDRMIEMRPEDQSAKTLAGQVAKKLMAEADRRFAKCEYADAVDCLDAVPAAGHDEAYTELRQKIDHVRWLSDQFDSEPYATPALGRLALRLSKHSPDDPRGKELVTRLAARLKEPVVNPRHLFPAWSGSRKCHLGGDASILAWPQRVDCKADAVTKTMPARFSVAIGLALQGLGGARVDTPLWEKRSLLGGMANRRKTKLCWGMDIGSSGIRAILLQRDAKETTVVQAYAAEYSAASRFDKEGTSMLACRDAIKAMLEAIPLGNAEVFVNFSSREVLARFVELPPVDDKKARSLLDAEVTDRFPVAVDELCMIKWISEKPKQEAIGRPAAILAARKLAVTNRVEFLTKAGLRVTGIQCESLAIVNFVAFEYATQWEPVSHAESPQHAHVAGGRPQRAAIAVVDAGAASTTLVVVDEIGFWFRTIEGGGDDMTLKLARSAKVVAEEAERLKRDPSTLTCPARDHRVLEERQEFLAMRLGQVIAEPLKQTRGLTITQTWAVGGACLGHAWMRRVLCRSTDGSI